MFAKNGLEKPSRMSNEKRCSVLDRSYRAMLLVYIKSFLLEV
jgi:hypothetical protein